MYRFRVYPKALGTHNIRNFGPKDHSIQGFWAILRLKVRVQGLNPYMKTESRVRGLGFRDGVLRFRALGLGTENLLSP